MAANLERLAEEFRQRGHPEMADYLDNGAKIARKLGVPESFPVAKTAIPVEARVTAQTTEPAFEIPTVNEELYLKTREALAKEGYAFVVDILPVSIGQLATDEETSQRFEYVNASENMRAIVPPQMEVVINPKNLKIKSSNSKSTDEQIRMLKKEEAALKAKLPQGIRDIVSIRMQNASVLAQIDGKYQKETGKVLFTDWYGRTDDQTVPGHVVRVGRADPAGRLVVKRWHRAHGDDNVFAVPVVVLPRKLAA